jgi:hypothetical protein
MWTIWNGYAVRFFSTIMHTLFENLFNSMIIEIIFSCIYVALRHKLSVKVHYGIEK